MLIHHFHQELDSMSADSTSRRPEPQPEYFYSNERRMSQVPDVIKRGDVVTTYGFPAETRVPTLGFVHDEQKKLFVLTMPDGTTEYFRDRPARQLLVEPDPETGELKPVINRGRPVYLYLCREEREVR
jgi:hypothetical protein